MKIAAAAVAALTATATFTSGCVAPLGCGGVDDATLEGEWAVSRMITYASPCPDSTQPGGELVVFIDPDAITIQESDDVRFVSARRWTEGERELVEIIVRETWPTPESPTGWVSPDVVYQLELVPVTGRLEGSMSTSYFFDTETTGTTCVVEGTASAGTYLAG
jgi:hypothetical protein